MGVMLSQMFLRACFVALPQKLGVPRERLMFRNEVPHWAIVWIRWCAGLFGAPIAVWALCACLPAHWVEYAGKIVDLHFWSYLKSTGLDQCAKDCRNLVSGLIATPLSWLLAIIGSIRLFKLADERIQWAIDTEYRSLRPDEARLITRMARSPWWWIVLTASCVLWAGYTYIATGAMSPSSWRYGQATVFTNFLFAVFLGLLTAGMSTAWFATRYRACTPLNFETTAAWRQAGSSSRR